MENLHNDDYVEQAPLPAASQIPQPISPPQVPLLKARNPRWVKMLGYFYVIFLLCISLYLPTIVVIAMFSGLLGLVWLLVSGTTLVATFFIIFRNKIVSTAFKFIILAPLLLVVLPLSYFIIYPRIELNSQKAEQARLDKAESERLAPINDQVKTIVRSMNEIQPQYTSFKCGELHPVDENKMESCSTLLILLEGDKSSFGHEYIDAKSQYFEQISDILKDNGLHSSFYLYVKHRDNLTDIIDCRNFDVATFDSSNAVNNFPFPIPYIGKNYGLRCVVTSRTSNGMKVPTNPPFAATDKQDETTSLIKGEDKNVGAITENTDVTYTYKNDTYKLSFTYPNTWRMHGYTFDRGAEVMLFNFPEEDGAGQEGFSVGHNKIGMAIITDPKSYVNGKLNETKVAGQMAYFSRDEEMGNLSYVITIPSKPGKYLAITMYGDKANFFALDDLLRTLTWL